MKIRSIICLSGISLVLGGLSVRAQVCDPNRPVSPWRASIETLAGSEARASMATLKYSESAVTTATPAETFAHGSDCFVAACRALEVNNPARARSLLDEAKASFMVARAKLDRRAVSMRALSAYKLGLIAEQHEADLTSAQAYYAEAVQLAPQNESATLALARVRRNLAFRQSFR